MIFREAKSDPSRGWLLALALSIAVSGPALFASVPEGDLPFVADVEGWVQNFVAAAFFVTIGGFVWAVVQGLAQMREGSGLSGAKGALVWGIGVLAIRGVAGLTGIPYLGIQGAVV